MQSTKVLPSGIFCPLYVFKQNAVDLVRGKRLLAESYRNKENKLENEE